MQAGDSFRIVVRRGPQPNQVFELNADMLNLGRDITNSITINDREVSRHHLRFTRTPDGYNLEDLGSTNGTFINGKRLSGMTSLKNGDMIGLGETVTLGYEANRPGMPATPQTPANAYQQPPQAPQSPAQPAAASPYQPPAANPYQAPQPPAANPYQAPQPPAANPYQAPQPPAANPYQAPQQPAPYAAPQGQYGAPPPQTDQYGQPLPADPYAQQGYGMPDPYGQQAGGQYGAPPAPGYDYDPYAMRESDARSPMRTVLLGCLALVVFCCCFTIIALVLVDTFNLYCQLPVINQVLQALGLVTCGVAG